MEDRQLQPAGQSPPIKYEVYADWIGIGRRKKDDLCHLQLEDILEPHEEGEGGGRDPLNDSPHRYAGVSAHLHVFLFAFLLGNLPSSKSQCFSLKLACALQPKPL